MHLICPLIGRCRSAYNFFRHEQPLSKLVSDNHFLEVASTALLQVQCIIASLQLIDHYLHLVRPDNPVGRTVGHSSIAIDQRYFRRETAHPRHEQLYLEGWIGIHRNQSTFLRTEWHVWQ